MNRDSLFLKDILVAYDRVTEYIKDGREGFESDHKTQDAVVRNLEIIGEATKQLTAELKEANADIPWRKIGGMRDKLIHHYFGVKLELVWETANDVVPPFRIRVARILENLVQTSDNSTT